jgi:hypothetical protein
MYPTYPQLSLPFLIPILWDILRKKHRSFQQDALSWTKRIDLHVEGRDNIPGSGPAILLTNHYHRPGFQALWFAFAISASVPVEIHWTITGAWTDDGTPGAKFRAKISPYLLPALARLYGFTSMPPMPPRPEEVEARANAVHQLISVARMSPAPILGLSPEGRDHPSGVLMQPPPGIGRLVTILDNMGFSLVPVGFFEKNRTPVVSFGEPFKINRADMPERSQRDLLAANQVMQAIARQLPLNLRGIYSV